jgi:N-acetylmuramoyl-L-alanine amidase
MSNKFKKTVALICAVCLAFSVMAMAASAEGSSGSTETELTDIQIYVDGLLASRGYLKNGITYASFESLCNAIGLDADVKWTDTADTANGTDSTITTMTAAVDGIEISYTVGNYYLCANGRYIYLPDGCIENDGTVLLPVRALAKIFTFDLSKDQGKNIVRIGTENMAVIESGADFYNADDAALLSHIIYAEAGNQPMAGMIGVGNVVLNRVASPLFPNTVRDVIYAPGQFEPVSRGSINLTPNADSVVAAYLALEGYNTVGDSMYFHNPGSSTSYLNSATFVVKIQDHVFFSEG